MRNLTAIALILLLFAVSVHADLKEGDSLPNPTLKSQDGLEVPLHKLLNKVTVIHLWKAN